MWTPSWRETSVFFGVLLSGCGIDETRFIPDYTEQYCALVFDCSESATLLFDGIGDQERCAGLVGPVVEAQLETCESYDGKAAKKCLKDMGDLTCPGPGVSLDSTLPSVCDDVFVDCKETPEQGNVPNETDTGTPSP
jgi:hypothetical protein